MPHILETYALQAGLKVNKPEVSIKYFPFDIESYICVCVSSGMESKNYDYWQDCLRFLFPALNAKKISVVQVGLAQDPQLKGVIDLRGKTNMGQLAYLIKNSILYLGNDSYGAHLAGYFNIPLVCLYAVNYPSLSKPYWCDPNKTFLIEAERNKRKPSFSAQENPKTINNIKPEQIVETVSKFLNLNLPNKHETLHIGPVYTQSIIETIPYELINVGPQDFLNIRYDFGGKEDLIYQQARLGKCNVVTKQVLNLEFLNQLRPNILNIAYIVDEENSLFFVKELRRVGLPYTLISFKVGDELNELKLRYMHYGVLQGFPDKKFKDIPNHEKITESTKFATNKIMVMNNKVYPSRWHWEKNISCESPMNTESTVIMDDKFWRDSDHYYLYNSVNTHVEPK